MEPQNSLHLIQKYQKVCDSTATYALIQLNIKNFRYYNTRYGILVGDEILQHILDKLLDFLNEEEYADYLYTDNFVLLLKCEDAKHMLQHRLVLLLDQLYRLEDSRIHRNIFFSMGIYAIVDRSVSFQSALNYANLCRKECEVLFRRSSCAEIYDKSFRDRYMARMDLEAETANAYKNYEFVTYLQPKVDLKTEQIVGAEALIRWFDKDGNSIPLYKFLPILNQNGYISLLDIDMFDQICQYLSERIRANKRVVPISFNISKSYFYRESLVEDYCRVAEKHAIPRSLIEIELMESISLDDTKQMKRVVGELKRHGFTCALDDFGNGYSSFSVLLNAQLDIIKMDRQFFLNNLNGDEKMIIKTVVDLIHSLKMKVVAEGVETQEHITYLRDCGCDCVQGYYFYKPMPIDDFGVLLDLDESTRN